MLKGNLITFRVIFVAGLKEVLKKFMFANMKRRDLKSICPKVVRAYLKFETKDNQEGVG